TVTAALSSWNGITYFSVPKAYVATTTIVLILALGKLNYFGPKHSGSFAISLALPMAVVVLVIFALSLRYLSPEHLRPSPLSFKDNWVAFTGVILALSGVEAVANLTGVMRLDQHATMDQPKVAWTARRAILPVMLEVVLGTALLGWAMLSLPMHLEPYLNERWEDMLRFLAEEYGAMVYGITFGKIFGLIVGVIVGLLLLSAVNTAIAALIGVMYMMARDGEMPKSLVRLNLHGVPWWPLIIAVGLPLIVVALARNLETLAGL